MIKLFKIILFSLVIFLLFTGCSQTNITNDLTSGIQGTSEEKFSGNKITVTSVNEISPIKEGSKVEINWAFPYIRYDERVYQIALDKVVDKDRVGKLIGKVERFLPASMVISSEPFINKNGDSNYAAEGSSIFEFSGKDVKEAIIIDDKGVFKEAVPNNN